MSAKHALSEAERQEFVERIETLKHHKGYSWSQISKAAGYTSSSAAQTVYNRGGAGDIQYLRNLRKYMDQKLNPRPKQDVKREEVRREIQQRVRAPESSSPTPRVADSRVSAPRSQSRGTFMGELDVVRTSLWSAAQAMDTLMAEGVPPFVRQGLNDTRDEILSLIEFLEG